ncbi:HNH endonuclease [Tupanvirus deep ocean]|uniref:HNH endonuclease n=2 Tax=Tupanvirus TaxID=2094720 RepID=A0AC62A871_9VIRU|nr:HNH endonuclease [Tupanvirus deep ocean]QKU33976.1 HNH endonuclease [Tupanvirus deep ocean]
MTKYPTAWAYGIPRGSISDRRTSLSLRISNGKKVYNFSYPISNFASKAECLKLVEQEKINKSRELGLTRNEVRFIDKDTIEVKLTGNKTFKTDAKYLETVNKYPLQAKSKREKGITRFYVVAQDKKKTFQFTKLITNFKIVEYVNGNTLDLREINMKEFGFGINVVDKKTDDIEADTLVDASKYYFMGITDLPKNKWILGSIEGTIFFREKEKDKILTMRTKNYNGQIQSKTYKVDDYGSVDKTIFEAKKYMINCAHYSGIVKNKIRIMDNFMEVMLDEDNIMKTDLIFLPLFIPKHENITSEIMVYKTYAINSQLIYASLYNKNTKKMIRFHKFIMGSAMIDHINGDTLDNRLINLRFTTYSHNNSNCIAKNNTNITGVTHGKDKTGEYYRARLKYDGKEHNRFFYVSAYGDNSKLYATKFRKYVLELNPITEDLSDLPLNKSDIELIKNSIMRTKEYLLDIENRICYDADKYLPGITTDVLQPDYKKLTHKHYLTIQAFRIENFLARITKLEDLIKHINLKYVKTIEI